MLMKKIFTLCLGLIAAMAVQAQSDFPVQFADKDGNVVADGTVLNLTEVVESDFGDKMIASGLYVKNTTANNVQVGGKYTITKLDNGAFQTCFPMNCVQKRTTGEFTTGEGQLTGGQLKDMQTEWMPEEEGSCVVTYQLVTYKQNPITKVWTIDQEGPKVTLNFTNGAAGVSTMKAGKDVRSVEYYNLTGRRVQVPARGMYIVKTTYSDGTSKTVKLNKK